MQTNTCSIEAQDLIVAITPKILHSLHTRGLNRECLDDLELSLLSFKRGAKTLNFIQRNPNFADCEIGKDRVESCISHQWDYLAGWLLFSKVAQGIIAEDNPIIGLTSRWMYKVAIEIYVDAMAAEDYLHEFLKSLASLA